MPSAKAAGSGVLFLPLSGGTVAGTVTATGSVIGTSNVQTGQSGQVICQNRFSLAGVGVDGVLKVQNTSLSAGVALNVATDGLLALKNRTNSAPGELDCAGGSVKEVRLASVVVDLNAAAKQTLYTVPTGKGLIVTQVVMRSPSGTPSGTARGGYGCDAGATDWGTSNVQLLNASNCVICVPNYTTLPYGAAAAFGYKATVLEGAALTVTVEVFGYLF